MSPASGVTSAAVAGALRVYDVNAVAVDSALALLDVSATRHDLAQSRIAFINARRAYKRVEWLAEHYTPLTASALNGPAIDKPDEESPQIIVHPTGLQVIEAMLYRANAPEAILDSVAIQARIARINIKRIRNRVAETLVTESQLFDAARIELGRMVSLGISGFDTPLVGTAIPEASATIGSISVTMVDFAPTSTQNIELQRIGNVARAFLDSAKSVDAFDRFTFITAYANPFARALAELQLVADVKRLSDRRAWNAAANSVFDTNAFDPQGFAPPGARPTSPQLVSLGERLFSESRLSGKNDRSCVTCHMPARALADGRRIPALLPVGSAASAKLVTANEMRVSAPPRNTPTLYNAALQAASFADARIAFLEDQIATVIHNPREMGGDLAR
ncbi:MAG: cytochrome c peroxidase, partial [Gemmatimonadaceae bacterium]